MLLLPKTFSACILLLCALGPPPSATRANCPEVLIIKRFRVRRLKKSKRRAWKVSNEEAEDEELEHDQASSSSEFSSITKTSEMTRGRQKVKGNLERVVLVHGPPGW
eukprot:6467318-Amphidinium_carterae.2